MRQGRASPRAQALAGELRSAIQGFEPATSAQQSIYAQELTAANELDSDRATRLLDMHPRLPPILWIALLGLTARAAWALDMPPSTEGTILRLRSSE
jgi:hypothetical protein